jgi:transposase
MDKDEIIRQLLITINELKRENELFKRRITELESRLAQYENAHTPPSLRRGGSRKKDQNIGSDGKPGQKEGHKGLTRPYVKPDNQVEVKEDRCPDCGTKLGDPFKVESKVIEDIPEPQPVIVTEYLISHYKCPHCQRVVVASDSNCPNQGKFGNNLIAQATLLKYEDRLPHRKIQNTLKRQFGLDICPATILDLTRRAADAVQSEYELILSRIRSAKVLYVDETSIDVQGKKHWIWIFTTPAETFVAIRNSRGMKVLKEVLTRRFKGTIVCDGWRPYANFTKHIQRCWAHLLRESNDLAQNIPEAADLHRELKELYDTLNDYLKSDPPPDIRRKLLFIAKARLKKLIEDEYDDQKVKKLIGKISNGFDYWFTFVVNPGIEPTNNRAERALREHVVQRKIVGTLRNSKGSSIHERIMTVLATWSQLGLNRLQMMRLKLSS